MSQEAKHTPGPWLVRSDEGFHNDLLKPDGRLLATFYPGVLPNGFVNIEGQQQAEANARLASAAPELLNAVKASRAVLTSILGTDAQSHIIAEQVALIDAAIGKAEVAA